MEATLDRMDIQGRTREFVRRQTLEMCRLCDEMLDVHRSNFVYREPSPKELREHHTNLKWAIRFCRIMHTQLSDPDFDDRELAAEIEIRIRQMQDAWDTFHDPQLSAADAERVLAEVFPR